MIERTSRRLITDYWPEETTLLRFTKKSEYEAALWDIHTKESLREIAWGAWGPLCLVVAKDDLRTIAQAGWKCETETIPSSH